MPIAMRGNDRPDPNEVPQDFSELMANRRGITDQKELEKKVQRVRKEALKRDRNPYLKSYRFVTPTIQLTEEYNTRVLPALKGGGTILLDVGTGFTQDLQQLLKNGVDKGKLYGLDKDSWPIDLGTELFGDGLEKDHLFTDIDMRETNAPDGKIKELGLMDKVNFLYVSKFFHLFTGSDRTTVAVNLLELMVKDGTGLIMGWTSYEKEALGSEKAMNERTWQQLWKFASKSFNYDDRDTRVEEINAKLIDIPRSPEQGEKYLVQFIVTATFGH
ncbi:Uu.00g016870.m01.CDS01 [Anthostomella pinea]|uniref:Uu.00g016870.m01.CDS01 n=1 Tax=Anthostomella pinea TaxID=933095 RepID=A0AAI8VYT0_9PEZI|nr:Uu.00g016870.m01.CDS01 [Anthostomella pinea]